MIKNKLKLDKKLKTRLVKCVILCKKRYSVKAGGGKSWECDFVKYNPTWFMQFSCNFEKNEQVEQTDITLK